MISPEAMQEWASNPMTIAFLELLEAEKQRIMEGLGNGHFLNFDNPTGSFGNAAHSVGEISGINRVFQLIQETTHDD